MVPPLFIGSTACTPLVPSQRHDFPDPDDGGAGGLGHGGRVGDVIAVAV